MFSWLIIAYGNKDLKTKSLGLPYTIVLEHFQFLRNAIENSFPVLVRKDVHQVLLQFVSLDQDISCTNTGCFTFCYDRFYSRNQRKYLELMENIWDFKNWIFIFRKKSSIVDISCIRELLIKNIPAFNTFVWLNYAKYSF